MNPAEQPQGIIDRAEHKFVYPNQRDTNDILKYLMNPQEIIQELENNFRGKVIDYQTREFKDIAGIEKPLMNELGITSLIGFCRMFISRVLTSSNLSDDEINMTMLDMKKRFVNLLVNHWDDYEIEPGNLRFIAGIIENAVFFTAKRAKDAGDRNLINNVERRIESYHEKDSRKSFFGMGKVSY